MAGKNGTQGRGARLLASLSSTFLPLRIVRFRNILVGTLFCNCAQQLQTVVAAWMMLQLTGSPDQVALVQTASAAPIMILSLVAGSFADIFDRRRVAIAAGAVGLSGALLLVVLAGLGPLAPWAILLSCLMTGISASFLAPAWQTMMRELLGSNALASGVALNATSNNLSKSVGASVGGILVVVAGAQICFAINALCYIPLLVGLLLWRRAPQTVNRSGTRERIDRAVIQGFRYAAYSRSSRVLLFRVFYAAVGTSGLYALLPFIAHEVLGGSASAYGLLLASFALGAVLSGLLAGLLRGRLEPETSLRVYSLAQGLAILVIAFSPFIVLSAVAACLAGACWVTNTAVLNVSIQLRTPPWIGARMVSLFYATAAAGLGFGSLVWGHLATAIPVGPTLAVAGGWLVLTPLLGRFLPVPNSQPSEHDLSLVSVSAVLPNAPERASGRVILEARYIVSLENSAAFEAVMVRLGRVRQRNGAIGWQLLRDASNLTCWIEQARYRDWPDYTAARMRMTPMEHALQKEAIAFHSGPEPVAVQRLIDAFGMDHSKD